MIPKIIFQKKGAALLMVFMFSIVLSATVMAYLNTVEIFSRNTSYKFNRYRTMNIAEAGVNRIAWYLKNTAPNGSTDGSWRGTVSETMSVIETGLTKIYTYNSASSDLPLEGPVISASSAAGANVATNAMDGNLNTFWRSTAGAATKTLTFFLAINGNYTMYLSRTRMMLGAGTATQFPANYTWQVSTNGATWTTVLTGTGNALYDVTDTFTLTQANYIRLSVTAAIGGAASAVNIAEVEIFGVVVPATPSASSAQGVNTAASAIDNNLATYWQSVDTAGIDLPEQIQLVFPSTSYVNGTRMRLGSAASVSRFPSSYTWQISTDGSSWTTVATRAGFSCSDSATCDVTDTFTAQRADYIRLNVTVVQGGGSSANVGETEIFGVNVISGSVSSSEGANLASRAVDGDLATYWQSSTGQTLPETLTIAFPPYVNKVRIRRGTGAAAAQFPQDYTWQVSSDGSDWTTVFTRSGLASSDVTDTFTLQPVKYLRLNVSSVQGGGDQVSVGEIDVPTACISSNCAVSYPALSATQPKSISYRSAQNAVIDGTPPSVTRQSKIYSMTESGQ